MSICVSGNEPGYTYYVYIITVIMNFIGLFGYSLSVLVFFGKYNKDYSSPSYTYHKVRLFCIDVAYVLRRRSPALR